MTNINRVKMLFFFAFTAISCSLFGNLALCEQSMNETNNQPKTDAAIYGLVLSDTAIRSGPSEKSGIIKTAHEGEEYACVLNTETGKKIDSTYPNIFYYSAIYTNCITAIETLSGNDYNPWYKISSGETTGWINGSLFLTGQMIDDNNDNQYEWITQRDLFGNQKHLKTITHGDYMLLWIFHNECCENYGYLADVWLAGKDMRNKVHLIDRSYLYYEIPDSFYWSPNDRFLYIQVMIRKPQNNLKSRFVFDLKNNEYLKLPEDVYTPHWTKDNRLLYINDKMSLVRYDPVRKTRKTIYRLKPYTIWQKGLCWDNCGDPPTSYNNFFRVKDGFLTLIVYRKNEAWEMRFRDDGSYAGKKLFHMCRKGDCVWQK